MSTFSGLSKWVGRQKRGAADGDMAQYENRVYEARLDERRRIARELHDRLGEVLTVGLRQLDLDEITGPQIPEGQSAVAREALVVIGSGIVRRSPAGCQPAAVWYRKL